MKKANITLILFMSFLFLSSKQKRDTSNSGETKWSGTVSFIEKRTGPGIIISEWRMDATITNDTGTATNKKKTETIVGDKSECDGQDKSELDVGIDLEAKTYAISVSIPDCNGRTITAGGSEYEFVQDGAIFINDQRFGTNYNVLSGNLTLIDSFANGSKVVTTYTWNLRTKCPPWNNPLTARNINTLDPRVRGPATRFIKRVNDELCIKLKVAAGKRTNAEQDEIYAQGRTRPGDIISWAKGGTSNHNSGLAIDVYLANDDGTIDDEAILPPGVIEIARQEGFEWGGSWKKF